MLSNICEPNLTCPECLNIKQQAGIVRKMTYICKIRSPTFIIFSLKSSVISSPSKCLSTRTRCAPNRIIWGSPWGLTTRDHQLANELYTAIKKIIHNYWHFKLHKMSMDILLENIPNNKYSESEMCNVVNTNTNFPI